MGIPSIRALSALLLLALPLGAQVAQDEAYKARYQVNYKRFTRGDDAKVVDEAWGRLEWFRERMGGDLSPEFTLHLLREAEKERAKYPSLFQSAKGAELPTAVGGTAWTSLGPTTAAFTQNGVTLNKVDSGRPRVILPDTADATGNTVYILACGGGLWKTTNFLSAAPTWTALTDFVGSNMSGSAAFGRSTSTLFVGAGDPFDLGVGGFMIKSTNGGSSWSSAAQLGTASIIYDLKVDTSQAQDIVLVGTNVGLYRSVNAGTSYGVVATLPATLQVWSLVRTSTGWLATTETSARAGAIYASTDQGATWAQIPGTTFSGAGRITLGVGQPGDATVYAYAANTNDASQLDLFRSTDGGATWTALNITTKVPTNSNSDNPNMALMGSQAFYNHMLLVDPSDASRNTVYLGGQLASAKTTNGGATWTLLSNWLAQFSLPYVHADFHCAAVSDFNGTHRLYFGTDGGLFTSTDGGATWDDTKNKGLVNHLIYALAANPGVAGSALVGLQDNGTRIRSGTSSTFNQVRGGDGFGVAWAQDVTSASAVSMSSYVYNAIQRATTSPVVTQSNWSTFTTGLGTTGSGGSATYYFVTPIITPPAGADPSGQVFFTYSRTGTIYQSSATGWTAIGTAGTGGISTGRIVRSVSHGVGVSPTASTGLQHIAAAGNGGYLLLTTNGGSAWTEVFLGAEPTTAGLVAGWQGFNANIAWANNNLLYVCSESPTAGAVRVAKSANGGSTWTAAATGLPDVPVTKLAVDPGDATGNTVYAATWIGVYRTTDGGATWSVFGTGLPQGRATDLWVAPDSTSLRVATWGRGVWEISVPTPVSFLTQPASVTVAVGHTATFSVQANGSGNLAYQWKQNGTAITGATSTTYTTPTLALTDTGATFSCDVTNSLGTVSSNAATLTVLALGTGTTASNATATAIPDATSSSIPGTPVDIPFTVSGLSGAVGEVTFSLYLTHTWVSDLVITLIAPNGTSVILSNNAGGPASASTNGAAFGSSCGSYLVFSDLGTASIGTQVAATGAPIVGTYQPSFPLSAFNGLSAANANGTWKLRLQDTGPADTGTYQCGILSVKPYAAGPSLDVNGDGVVDLRDLLFLSKNYGLTTASCDLNSDGTVNDADLTILLAGL
jgi:subtilisin-like proprotein convertase family protein